MARVVVIGAGVGGLAAGVRLAAAGHDVTLFEAGDKVGGKLAGHNCGGFTFDTGPTLLTLPGEFEALFAATGAPLSDVLPMRRLDTIASYRWPDGSSVDTTSDLGRQSELFDEAFGSGAGAAWQRVLDRSAAIWSAVEQPVFGTGMSARTALGLGRRLARPRDLRAVAPLRTLRSVANTLLDDPRQRMMLERYATYEGSDPRRAPAALAVVPYLEHRFGAWYVEGGLHRLATALADRFTSLGGRLELGSRVTRVDGRERVSGVLVGDSPVAADVVVSDVDAHSLYSELTHRRRVPPADSLGGFVMLLAVREPLPDLGHHTVLFGDTPYDDEFDAIFGASPRPVPEPVLYLNSPRDASVAPAGCRSVYVLVNAPRHGPVDWDAPGLADRYADGLLAQLAGRGVDLRASERVVLTPADLERSALAPGGAIYGQVQHGAFASLRRAHNRSRTRGLFLVGGSTHPGGGLPLVAMSARVVADAIGRA